MISKKSNKSTTKAAKSIKAAFKSAKRQTLDEIAQKMHDAKAKNAGKLPHNYVPIILAEMKPMCPWLNRHAINYHFSVWKKRQLTDINEDSALSASDSSVSHINQPNSQARLKGGRPKGTTEESKKRDSDALIAAKNEIAVEYKKAKTDIGDKPVSNGTMHQIIKNVKAKRGIPDDIEIKVDTIRRRVARDRPIISSLGSKSPLAAIEAAVVIIIIQMARIRRSLTPSNGLKLVNDMINGTDIQKDLIKWKEINTSNTSGSVGKKYWRNFMRRHGDKIISKRGAKYSLDRANWSTYSNFKDMYDHNYEEMEVAGVAKRRAEPVWMDRNGNICDEKDALGCKVTHDLIHPEMCLVGDEVGGNLNMDNDGYVGGEKLLCAKGTIPQQKTSTRDKHFTLLPLVLLTGKPLMCIIIIAGKKPDVLVEMGINGAAEMNGEEGDEDFFEKNSGVGKLYPGGPTCTVRGIEVPCFIRWSTNGSITSEILTEALMEIDRLGVMPRVDGVNPFLLVDRHGSRFGLDFLSYINNPDHEWVVCIGTPYGTALWQVGDSKECNGSLNIALSKAKKDMLDDKTKMCMQAQLKTYDIIPLVNTAWLKSFYREDKNKNAIADRGWGPLNRSLLLNNEIRATMTEEELQLELAPTSTALVPYTAAVADTTDDALVTTNNTLATFTPMPTLNFEYGNAAHCLDSIVQHDQLHKARQRIKKEQENGKSLLEKINVSKRVTAGILVKAGSHRLGQTVFQVVKERAQAKADEIRRKITKAKDTHNSDIKKADAVLSAKPPDANNSENPRWTIKDLQQIIKPLKLKTDGPMPTKKPALLLLYRTIVAKGRKRAEFSDYEDVAADATECTDLVPIDDACDECDEIGQMEMI